MLLTKPVLDRILAGEVDLVFRRWRKPTVKPGGTLRTMIGELSIHDVDVVTAEEVDDDAARRAGFPDAAAVLHELFRERTTSGRGRIAKPDETSLLYRVRVSYKGTDPRAAMREQLLTDDELTAMVAKLGAMDARSERGPWTFRSLELIRQWPGRRAPELAEMEGCETLPWKAQIRRLKELGLTESLRIGYRLSPRGEQVLDAAE